MIRSPRSMISIAVAASVALASFALPLPALAQQGNIQGAARIINTARVPGTVTQAGTLNSSDSGVFCTFHQSAEVGNPSTVISVEVQDVVSSQWQVVGTAAAVTNSSSTGVATLLVYPGAVATSVPSGMAVFGLKVSAAWRLKQVITGGTSTTGSSACDLLN